MPISIEPTGATLGAVIRNVDLRTLDEDTWAAIEQAFLEHALLIFPEQHLTEAEQVQFAERFGDIEILVDDRKSIPISNRPDGAILGDESHHMQLLKGNEGWHTDSSYMPVSAKASVLSAHVVPKSGSETEWADVRAAYDALDEETRSSLNELNAYHCYFHSQAQIGHKVEVGAGYGFFDGEPPLHPLVKIHPVTKRPALFIGRHIKRIAELDEAESEQLVQKLMFFSCQSPRTYRHAWRPGDVVVWDNRCVLHRARPYDQREERLMLHTRVKGDPATESALNA